MAPDDRRVTGAPAYEMRETDEHYLREAIRLAAESRLAGDPPFGSLLVRGSRELARANNTSITDHDITAHPELKLARWTARELSLELAAETTMYTSCEPCPMCANAISRARLGRVVFALSNEDLQGLKPVGFVNPDSAKVSYDGPWLFDEARVPLDGYYS